MLVPNTRMKAAVVCMIASIGLGRSHAFPSLDCPSLKTSWKGSECCDGKEAKLDQSLNVQDTCELPDWVGTISTDAVKCGALKERYKGEQCCNKEMDDGERAFRDLCRVHTNELDFKDRTSALPYYVSPLGDLGIWGNCNDSPYVVPKTSRTGTEYLTAPTPSYCDYLDEDVTKFLAEYPTQEERDAYFAANPFFNLPACQTLNGAEFAKMAWSYAPSHGVAVGVHTPKDGVPITNLAQPTEDKKSVTLKFNMTSEFIDTDARTDLIIEVLGSLDAKYKRNDAAETYQVTDWDNVEENRVSGAKYTLFTQHTQGAGKELYTTGIGNTNGAVKAPAINLWTRWVSDKMVLMRPGLFSGERDGFVPTNTYATATFGFEWEGPYTISEAVKELNQHIDPCLVLSNATDEVCYDYGHTICVSKDGVETQENVLNVEIGDTVCDTVLPDVTVVKSFETATPTENMHCNIELKDRRLVPTGDYGAFRTELLSRYNAAGGSSVQTVSFNRQEIVDYYLYEKTTCDGSGYGVDAVPIGIFVEIDGVQKWFQTKFGGHPFQVPGNYGTFLQYRRDNPYVPYENCDDDDKNCEYEIQVDFDFSVTEYRGVALGGIARVSINGDDNQCRIRAHMCEDSDPDDNYICCIIDNAGAIVDDTIWYTTDDGRQVCTAANEYESPKKIGESYTLMDNSTMVSKEPFQMNPGDCFIPLPKTFTGPKAIVLQTLTGFKDVLHIGGVESYAHSTPLSLQAGEKLERETLYCAAGQTDKNDWTYAYGNCGNLETQFCLWGPVPWTSADEVVHIMTNNAAACPVRCGVCVPCEDKPTGTWSYSYNGGSATTCSILTSEPDWCQYPNQWVNSETGESVLMTGNEACPLACGKCVV